MVRDVWITKELRPGREHEMWCNAILTHNSSVSTAETMPQG